MSKKFFTTAKTIAQSLITTLAIAISFTFAQGSLSTSTPDSFGFFGDMSIKVYCTFSNFIPGSDNSACSTDIFVNDNSNDNAPATTTDRNGSTTLTTEKFKQITGVINQGLNSNARIVYVPVKGDKGDNGTTTIIYSGISGAVGASPAAYIYAGGNTNSNPYQTTVPADIYSTFIHFLKSEIINTQVINAVTANATTTNTENLNFQNATGTNLLATGTAVINNLVATNSTTTNLFANYASLTNSTSTNLFSVLANIWDLYFNNATGTNLSITNITSTGTFAIATGTIASTTIQDLNVKNTIGNIATFTSATTTNVFATNASITNATTTYFFAAWANFLNLFVNNLTFNNATGTNFTATGTSVLANAIVASSTLANTTIQNGEIKAGNATLTTAVINNATTTNLFSSKASITSATTTNIFTAMLRALNARIDNLAFTSATGTNLLLSSMVATSTIQVPTLNASTTNASTTNATNGNILNLISTNATLTNATITNLRVTNCAEGNVVCNGGNDTGAVLGTDAPLTIGVLNAGNINFITGDLGAPSVTPGTTKLVIETGLAAEGSGAVRVTNDLKVGANIVASGTITATNIVATGTATILGADITRATITNATTTSLFANLLRSLNGSIDSLATVNATFTAATTTNFRVTNIFAALTASITNLLFANATGTNATTTNFFSTSIFGNNSVIGNGTSTNFFTTNFVGTNATTTNIVSINSTSTNLFATLANFISLRFINATGTNLTTTGTSNLSTIVSASSTLGNTTITSGNANLTGIISTRATITNATTTGASYVGGVAVFNDDVTINNQLNVDAGTLFINDVDERVGINTATPITAGNVRLTVAGDIRVGTTGTNGCVQRFDGNSIAGTCSSDEQLKENITNIDGQSILSKISNLNFVSYSWNDLAEQVYGNVKGTKILGVTAQNVEAIFPELVTTDEQGYKRVNLTDLQWYLFGALKELATKVNSMNQKVQTNELCIGSECITEQDLRDFKAWKNSQQPAPEPTPEPVDETPVAN